MEFSIPEKLVCDGCNVKSDRGKGDLIEELERY